MSCAERMSAHHRLRPSSYITCDWFRQAKMSFCGVIRFVSISSLCRCGACRKQNSGLALMTFFFPSLSLDSCTLPYNFSNKPCSFSLISIVHDLSVEIYFISNNLWKLKFVSVSILFIIFFLLLFVFYLFPYLWLIFFLIWNNSWKLNFFKFHPHLIF